MSSHFITAFLVTALIPLLVRLLMRSALKQSAEAGEPPSNFIMSPSRVYRRLAFGSAAFGVILVGTFVYVTLPFPKLAVGLGALVLPLALLFLTPMLDLRRRVHVSPEGLQSISPWTGKKSATWEEVQSVQFREWGHTIRIRLRNGGLIVIPCSTMTGIPALKAAMRKQLQPQVLEHAFDQHRASMGT